MTVVNNTKEGTRLELPVWQIEVPDGTLLERQILSVEDDFSLIKAHYLVEHGVMDIFMPPFSAAVLTYQG